MTGNCEQHTSKQLAAQHRTTATSPIQPTKPQED